MKKLVLISVLFLGVATIFSCKKSTTGCVENISQDCFWTTDVAPVCGCNGKTYGNASKARCAGIKEYTEGACP
ncbi:MAG: kazal domain protein [Aureispira sp.]|nr:kazal domain protein [Aureispira sp.]